MTTAEQDGEHLRLVSVFHYVLAYLSCLLVPVGTVPGVFTLRVLLRPTVKPLFA